MVLGPLPGLHFGLAGLALAQVAGAAGGTPPHPLLIRLVRPAYPPLAWEAGVTGDVTIEILIRQDGTVGSAEVVNGHSRVLPNFQIPPDPSLPSTMVMYPLLRKAALDSALQLRFKCANCERSYLVTYTFTIFPEKLDPCCCTSKEGDSSNPVSDSSPSLSVKHDETQTSDLVIFVREKPACMCPDRCPSTMRYIEEHARFRAGKCLYLWKCGHRMIILE